MSVSSLKRGTRCDVRTPRGLSERIMFLRDYYFRGVGRSWNNEYTSWSTGTDRDVRFNELTYYIAPESHLAIIFLWLYPVTEERYRENLEMIKEMEYCSATGKEQLGGAYRARTTSRRVRLRAASREE